MSKMNYRVIHNDGEKEVNEDYKVGMMMNAIVKKIIDVIEFELSVKLSDNRCSVYYYNLRTKKYYRVELTFYRNANDTKVSRPRVVSEVALTDMYMLVNAYERPY